MRLDSRQRESTFLDCWTTRMVRRAVKDFPGKFLDASFPLPEKTTLRIQRWAEPIDSSLQSNLLSYKDIFMRISNGQPVTIPQYLKGTIWSSYALGFIAPLVDGAVFSTLMRSFLTIYTGYLVFDKAKQRHKQTNSYVESFKAATSEAGRWLIGAEVGKLGYAWGITQCKKKGIWMGIIAATLISAAFDYVWKKLFIAYPYKPVPARDVSSQRAPVARASWAVRRGVVAEAGLAQACHTPYAHPRDKQMAWVVALGPQQNAGGVKSQYASYQPVMGANQAY